MRTHTSPVSSNRPGRPWLIAPPALLLLALAAGCGKPPTFQELMGNKPTEAPTVDLRAPAPPSPDPAPAPRDPAPAAPQPKPDPAAVLARFREKQSFDIEDKDLEQIAHLEEGLDTVDKLNLSFSKVTQKGVEELQRFPALKQLNLGGLKVTYAMLGEVGKLSGLESLGLAKTPVDDAMLESIAGLVNLKELDLSSAPITDNGFAHFDKLVNLEVLKVGGTSINGSGFKVFDRKNRHHLREIDANHTGFGAYGFVHIKDSKSLEVLNVIQAAVTDGSMVGLRNCLNLREVYLSFNELSDLGVREMAKLKKLETVDLRSSGNATDQGVLQTFGTHKSLQYLNLDGTRCTPAIAPALRKNNKDLKVRLLGQLI